MLTTMILAILCLTMLCVIGALICIIKLQSNTMKERMTHVEPPKIKSWLDADWREIQ